MLTTTIYARKIRYQDCENDKETEQHVSQQRDNTLNVPSTAQDIVCNWTEEDRFALQVLMFADGVPNN